MVIFYPLINTIFYLITFISEFIITVIFVGHYLDKMISWSVEKEVAIHAHLQIQNTNTKYKYKYKWRYKEKIQTNLKIWISTSFTCVIVSLVKDTVATILSFTDSPQVLLKIKYRLYNIFLCTLLFAMPPTSQLSTREKLMRQNCSFSNYVMQFDLLGLFFYCHKSPNDFHPSNVDIHFHFLTIQGGQRKENKFIYEKIELNTNISSILPFHLNKACNSSCGSSVVIYSI